MRADDPFGNRTLSQQEKAHVAQQLKPDLVKGIDSIATRFHERYDLNTNVMVNYKGHKLFEKAYGTTGPRSGEPLSSDDRYQLASVSKQFTAVAALMLVEDGKLDLSDTVQHHLPYFQYDRITVEQLLHHTAGLPNYMWAVEHHWDKDRPPYNHEVLKLMDSIDLNLYFRPGTSFFYSNTGYITLAQIVEEVSGQRFDSFLRQRVFQPLDMETAFVRSKAWDRSYPDHLSGFRSRGYRTYEVEDNQLDGVVGDKGIYAATSDLYKWDQALYNGTLLADSLQEAAFRATILPNGGRVNYGYGFRLEQFNEKPVVYHNGLWHGFRTSLKRYVTDSISLVVLNNRDSRTKGELVDRLEAYLHKHQDPGPVFQLVFQTLQRNQPAAQSQAEAPSLANHNKASQLREVIRYLRLKRVQEPAQQLSGLYDQYHTEKQPQASLSQDNL
jgi:CubicO group peptidase (beta-lactamase class C family)